MTSRASLGHAHRSNLRADTRTKAPSQHQRRENRADFLDHREGEHVGKHRLRTELDQGPSALHGQHRADGQPGHTRQQETSGTDFVHLAKQFPPFPRAPKPPRKKRHRKPTEVSYTLQQVRQVVSSVCGSERQSHLATCLLGEEVRGARGLGSMRWNTRRIVPTSNWP